jgi:hypothetical protein
MMLFYGMNYSAGWMIKVFSIRKGMIRDATFIHSNPVTQKLIFPEEMIPGK